MARIDKLKSFYKSKKDQMSSVVYDFADNAYKKSKRTKNYLVNRHGVSLDGVLSGMQKSKNIVRRNTQGFANKLSDKWDNRWKYYKNYFLYDLSPWVLVYGAAINFMFSQFGLIELSLGKSAASGLGFYFVKQELPELIQDIRYRTVEG